MSFTIDLFEKFELLNNRFANYTIQVPVSIVDKDGKEKIEVETSTEELTIKDVFIIVLSKTSRVECDIDFLICYVQLFLRFREYLKEIEEYLLIDEKFKKKKFYQKPVFEIKTEKEKELLIALIDRVIIFPKDESLDNIIRGYLILLLMNEGSIKEF